MTLPAPSPTARALVTGASSGIGEALSRQLARRGHHLILVARRRDRLEKLATELRAHGVSVDVFACDLADSTARATLVTEIRDAGLEVTVLVNNAGFATGGPFADVDPEDEVAQVRVLVEAVVALTAAFLPAMVDRGEGAILNVASTAGMQPLPYSAGYCAAKAHVLAFSEALHHEVASQGVTVTALCPGPVKTEFWQVAGDQPIKKTMPRPMWVGVDQVAAAGIRGLERGRRVVVPGLLVRWVNRGGGATPHGITLPILARVMRPAQSGGSRRNSAAHRTR